MRQRLDSRLRFELLEPRQMLSATAFEANGIGYFLDATNRELDRYDIANQSWLASTPLAGATTAPTVALADADGIYVAYGTAVYRYNLNGTSPTHLLNAANMVSALHSDGNLLFVNHSSGLYARFVSINKTTNTIIANFENYVDSVYGSSIAPAANRIFGRTGGISPADISYVSYTDAGAFSGGGDSPYHGDYPNASTTWTFPDGGKVVDDSGTIYSTNSLTRLNNFGSRVDEIDFVGGVVPIVRTGNTVTAYSLGILPTGSRSLTGTPREILVNGQNIIAIYNDGSAANGYSIEIVPLSTLNAPQPGEPINPNGLVYTPDKIVQGSDGNVLLFSKTHQSVFRWDPVRQEFGTTIPLIGAPDFMTYSGETNTIYLAYSTGLIRKIDLSSSTPSEVAFASLPSSPLGLATAGGYVFAVDPSGAWVSHYTFDPNGTLISEVDWNYYSSEYVWSEVTKKMYFFRDDTSPNDLLSEDIVSGVIGIQRESPLHDSSGFNHPIRVSPDGSIVVLGSGKIHDAASLARKTESLTYAVSDVAWLGTRMYSVRNAGGVAQVQEWVGSTYAPGNVKQFTGTPVSLTAVGSNRLLMVSMSAAGVPLLTLLDSSLNVVSRPTPVADAGSDANVPIGVALTLDGSDSYDPDNSPNPLTYQWSILSGPAGGTFGDAKTAVTTFRGNAAGEYKLQLVVSDGVYSDSDVVTVRVRTNVVPVADASLSATVAVANRIPAALDGSRSADADGDTLQYQWTIMSSPAGSNPNITNALLKNASFSTDLAGSYKVKLHVSDGYLSDDDTVTITVSLNKAPTADATLSGLTGVAGRVTATLNGSRSSDPDADALTYLWKVIASPAGSLTSIGGATQKTGTFAANMPGNYTLELLVGDGQLSDTDIVVITMGENQSPIADASMSVTSIVAGGAFPTLDGRASSDPEGDALTYQWKVVSSTNGIIPTISGSKVSVATLNTNVAGVYAVSLVVSDGLKTDIDYILVSIQGNQPPVADASLTSTLGWTGSPIVLDGTRSRDPDGDELSYHWEILASTSGVVQTVSNPDDVLASFTTTAEGTYLAQLTVGDDVATSSDFRLITVRSKPNPLMLGDSDGDNDVDGRDFLAWQRGYGIANAQWSNGDSDSDGDVDRSDLAVWQLMYNPQQEVSSITADFDQDGDIDGRDFLSWQRGYGTSTAQRVNGNADGDTDVDAADLNVWQQQYVSSTQSVVGLSTAADSVAVEVPPANSLIDAAMLLLSTKHGPIVGDSEVTAPMSLIELNSPLVPEIQYFAPAKKSAQLTDSDSLNHDENETSGEAIEWIESLDILFSTAFSG